LLILLNLGILPNLFSQNVSINSTGSLPDTSAMLDISSTTKGFLMPRMTTTERDAIILPATGLTIFNTTIVAYQVNTGIPVAPIWSTLNSGAGSVSSVSVTSANGLGGAVATATTTPNITLTTSVTGMVKGDGTGFLAAIPGTDYLTGNQTISFAPTGDVTGSTTGTTSLTPALTIGNNKVTTAKILNANVTNAKLANMAANTIKGVVGAGAPTDLSVTQVTAMLNPFAGSIKGLVPASAGGTVNFLRADGAWQPLSTNAWSLTGNSGTTAATNFIGTTDAMGFRIKGNSIQGLLVDSLGNVAVGIAPTFTALSGREKFLVDAGTTSSINAISAKGSINSYLQLNVQNQSNGTAASSDLVATSDNGSESNNFIDMGINGSGNTSNILGNANDAYLYNQGENFFIANSTPSRSLILMTGGTDSATNERVRIDGTGNVGIGNPAPAEKLDVTGNVKFSGALMPNNLPGTAGNVLISNGAGASPTWSTAITGTNTGDVTIGTANGLSLTGQALSLGLASTSATGALSSTDWNTFNNKGSGSVTSVSVTTANGVSGTVATATTTPAITLTLGAITPTSVAATSTLSGTQLISTIATGTAPLIVTSTTPVANLSIGGNAATVTTNANLTGMVTSVGNATTVVTNANLTGEVTSVGNAATVSNAAVIGKVLTGYASTTGAILATDNILQAIQKLNGNNATNANLTGMVTSVGNAATVVTNANLTGEVTSVGNAATVSNAAVIGKVLTGYVSGAGTISATDNILQAIQKLNGNNATNANLTGPVTSVGNATAIGSNVVTNAMLATMPTLTIKGNNTGGAANAADLTVAQVNAILPVFTSTLNGLVPLSGGSAGKVLHGDGTWKDTTASTNQWSITGNTGTTSVTNFIGTTDNKSFKVKTFGNQVILVDSLGSVGIGTAPRLTSGVTREKFLVDAGSTNTNTLISAIGDNNSFLQMNIQNTNNGIAASSDVIATANNGTDNSAYVDMGINSQGYSTGAGLLNGSNTAYLYATGNNFYIGNGAQNKDLILFTNTSATGADGTDRLHITAAGNVGIGIAAPTTALHVVKNNSGSDVLNLQNTSASGFSSADFFSSAGAQVGTFGYGNASVANPLFAGRDYFAIYGNDFLLSANSTSAALFVEGTNSNVGINTITPNSAFEVNGAMAIALSKPTGTGTVTLDNTASVWYITTALTSINFPTASTCTNRIYTIVNRSGGSRTTSSFTNMSNASTATVVNGTSIDVMSDGSNWLQIR